MQSAASSLRHRSIVTCLSGLVVGLVILDAQQAPSQSGHGPADGRGHRRGYETARRRGRREPQRGALAQTVLSSGEVCFRAPHQRLRGSSPAPKQILTDATGRFLFVNSRAGYSCAPHRRATCHRVTGSPSRADSRKPSNSLAMTRTRRCDRADVEDRDDHRPCHR